MADRPNVIVCTCDQLRAFEVGCYGNGVIRTPNIDRLAQRGVRFETAVTNNPVCMPARSCLLSGQYSRTCMGSVNNASGKDAQGKGIMPEYPVEERVHFLDATLPEQLRGLGYETALFGKWHIQPSPGTVGFDYALFPRVHHRHTGQTFVENTGEGEVVEGFSVDFEAERVRAFLDGDWERPFFMFYNISPPHMPLDDAPEKYLSMYAPDEIPLRPNVFVDGEMPFDERWFKIYLWDFLFYQEGLPHTEKLPEGFDLRRLIALYYGMTTWVDDMVGLLMAGLEANGLAEDTVVVFLSDHGDNLGSHHLFNKGQLIEESIRIPMIFHAPGRWESRANTSQVAQMIDVMPTVLEICGAEVPEHVQGRSLASILSGAQERLAEDFAFVETADGQVGVRTPTHTYGIRLAEDRRTVADERHCFYDLREDPYEMENLAKTEKQVEVAEELRRRVLGWNKGTRWMGKHGG